MDMVEETEQTAHADEPEEEQPMHNVCIFTVPVRRSFLQHVILK